MICAAILAGCPLSVQAASLTCGPQPEIVPAEQAAAATADIEGKAALIFRAQSNSDLRGFIRAQRQALRHEHADVDASLLDAELLWSTCRAISNDPIETGSSKFDRYADLYRLLSEPIRSATHAE
jgi:hypothetical protein